MYTKVQLQSECSTRVDFQHGLAYYSEGRVENIQFEEKKNTEGSRIIEVKSTVKGEHDSYTVRAFIDEAFGNESESGKLLMKYCSCPGSNEPGRICKHCIATLLKYFDKRDSLSQNYAAIGLENENNVISSETDGELLKVLREHSARKKIDIKLKNQKDTMRIVPLLTLNDASLDVEFKAGMDKLYIVKNIGLYVQAVQTHSRVQYGKNRSVLHSMSIFDDASKKILNFLERYEQNRITHIQSYSAKPDTDGRYLTLKNETIDNFFNATIGTEILVNNSLMNAKKGSDTIEIDSEDGYFSTYELYKVEKGLPELSFTVTGLDGNGLIVTGVFPKIFAGLDDFIIVMDKCFYIVPKTEIEACDFFEYIAKSNTKKIYVAEQDIPLFVNEMLTIFEKYCKVERIDFDEKKYIPDTPVFKFFIDAPSRNTITCEAIASYKNDEKRFNILADRDYSDSVRDEASELNVFEEIKKYFNKYDPVKKLAVLSDGEERFYDFLTKNIYEMEEIGELFISDKLKSVSIKKASSIQAGVSLQGDLLKLTVHSDDFSDAQLTELLTKYSTKKKYFRLTDGTFISVDGENFENLSNIAKTLALSGHGIHDGEALIPKYRAVYLDTELSDTADVKITRSKDFRALIRNMKLFSDNEFDAPVSIQNLLKQYQKAGFRWLKTLYKNGFGGILADEMGLGKTIQTIAFLLSEYEEGEKRGSIIVCPASLVYNWKNEFERFAPSLTTFVVAGKQEERAEILSDLPDNAIIITSYDLLRRDIDIYRERRFAFQIIDEAQYIKNSNTLSSKTVKQINAGFRLALTGTPIENRLSELWSIFDYLMPGFLHSYKQFKEEYEIPIVQMKDKNTLSRLQRIIHPFVLRRLKSEVLKDLPDKIEESVMTQLLPEQKELYVANWKRIKENIGKKTKAQIKKEGLQILAELMKLRELCCDPRLLYDNYGGGSAKLELCLEMIQKGIAGGHKILVFSQFTSMLEMLENKLKEENIDFYSLIGQTPKEKRTQLVSDFNNGDVPVFCISLKAGGTGLNLTSADIVIHFDPWWNVAVQNQATDRAHRIGQKKIVTVYKLIAKGTIEENIMNLQEKKKELAGELLSGAEFTNEALTKEDLLELLG